MIKTKTPLSFREIKKTQPEIAYISFGWCTLQQNICFAVRWHNTVQCREVGKKSVGYEERQVCLRI